jgi:hypothetical protein
MQTPISGIPETELNERYRLLLDATSDRKRRGIEFGQACYELKPRLLGKGWRTFLRENHISHKTADSWSKKWAGQQQLPWKQDDPRGFWFILYHRINALRPSISDGAEHRFVTALIGAASEVPQTKAEQNYRLACIKSLREVAAFCVKYADILEVPCP